MAHIVALAKFQTHQTQFDAGFGCAFILPSNHSSQMKKKHSKIDFIFSFEFNLIEHSAKNGQSILVDFCKWIKIDMPEIRLITSQTLQF